MSETPVCALCQGEASEPVSRPLFPQELAPLFDIDPLGTGGAAATLCRGCAEVLAAPMFSREDLEALARAVALHREFQPPAHEREARAARARLFHRALHLGLQGLVAELAGRPPAPPARPDPDQLGLFVSKTARLSLVEQALSEADLPKARAMAEELVKRFDMKEARYLAAALPRIESQINSLHGDAEALAFLAAGPEGALERGRLPVSLAGAFQRGLHRLVARSAEDAGEATVMGRPVGWYWVKAGELERARTSLEAAVSAARLPGQALMLLGNIAHARRDTAAARGYYRRALQTEPRAVYAEEIADEQVRELFSQARTRGLPPAEGALQLGEEQGIFARG
jgi:tetratricopeptide (TPR) repeat protein